MNNLRLVIIGGVAGGASAATRARRLSESAEITVFERGNFVSFANCGIPYYIGEEIKDQKELVLQTPQSFHARYNIDVRLRSEVIAIDSKNKLIKVRNLDEKSEYDLLSDGDKNLLKSAFLFSGKNKCWVSRAKEPNLYKAKQIASELGFTEEVREGERLSFAEQLQKKAERAEERAERFETYADNAQERQKTLQKPLNDMHGDIAFFTQPIIAGHSGCQAFAKRREKLFERYEKGFEEYRKSEYFRGRADIVRSTAGMEKLKDKGYLDRKVKEFQKEIRDRKKT